MTFPGQIKRTPLPAEEGQVCLGRNSPHVENHESLTETVKWLKEKNERLAERVELLEELSKKTSAAEGKIYRVNYVLHLKICIKEQQI